MGVTGVYYGVWCLGVEYVTGMFIVAVLNEDRSVGRLVCGGEGRKCSERVSVLCLCLKLWSSSFITNLKHFPSRIASHNVA